MQLMRKAALVSVVLVVVAAAVALAPSVYGQIVRLSTEDEGPTRHVEVMFGASEIGVSVRDVESSDVTREKLSAAHGAVVDEVRRDSPAAKAGLRTGDVLVEFDGERVRSARHLSRLVQETPSGRAVKAVVVRGGERKEVQVTPGEGGGRAIARERLERSMADIGRDLRMELRGLDFDGPLVASRPRLGVSVQDLTPQLASYFGATGGVLVTGVNEDSPAARGGLKAGDVIASVNGRDVGSPRELTRELARVDEGEVTLGIVRDKKSSTLKATIESDRPRVRRRADIPI